MAFTSGTLLEFAEGVLGPLTTQLALGGPTGALSVEVDEIVRLLGHAIEDEADQTKLSVLARWRAWLAATTALAPAFDLKAGTVDLKRSQQFKQAAQMLGYAERAAAAYPEAAATMGGGSVAVVTTIAPVGSPYR